MNGYLNNLALRSMNAGNLVEPRLPSLFEPQRFEPQSYEPQSFGPQPRLESATIASQAGNTERRIEQMEEVPPAADVPATDPQLTNPPSTNLSTTAVPAETAREETPVNVRVEEAVPASIRVSEDTRVYETPETVQIYETRSTIREALTEKRTEAATEKSIDVPIELSTEFPIESPPAVERVSPPNAATRTPVRPKLPSPPAEKSVPESVKSVSQDTAAAVTVERTRNTNRTDFKSTTTNRFVTNYARRELIESSEPEQPAINVTIGRVEVRAVPTNSKPARPSRQHESPVMPLEEYLRKQRRGGER